MTAPKTAASTARAAQLQRGQSALVAGDFEQALALAAAVLREHPTDLQGLILRANASSAGGWLDNAIDSLQALRRHHPRPQFDRLLGDACNRRGNQRLRAQQLAAALADFDAAIAAYPQHPHAHFNLALLLARGGRNDQALVCIQQHLSLFPDDWKARLQAIEWQLITQPEQAIATLQESFPHPEAYSADVNSALARLAARCGDGTRSLAALRTASAPLTAALEAAHALNQAGAAEDAVAVYRHATRLSSDGERSPGLLADIGARLSLPPIPRSSAHIDDCRERFAAGLDWLEDAWTERRLARCAAGLDQLRWSNFLLAYHGCDDRSLQARYGRLLQRALAQLVPAAADTSPVPGRIGLVSSFFRDCTVAAYFGSWIGWLRDAGYQVHLYQLGPTRDAVTDRLAGDASHFHYEAGDADALAAKLRADRLEMLIYPELGMDARLFAMAGLRLAPHQLAGWGHPQTSGLSTIDGWLSCADMEPDDAAAHYSERLLCLPGLGVDYRRPPMPAAADRSALGLPASNCLILVPQSLFKLHPDNDLVFAQLLAARPQARLVLFDGEVPQWKPALLDRLRPTLRAAGADPDALLWLPIGDRQRYLQINRVCDFMLDSLHWSGGNTSLDALSSGLPVLSCPGRFMRGRQSLAMLQRLGLTDPLICRDPLHLAERAIALIDAPQQRQELRAAILDRLDTLFASDGVRETLLAHVGNRLAAWRSP